MCGVLFILAGLGAGVCCLWNGLRGLASGVVVASSGYRGTSYARAADPLAYWLTEIGVLVLGAFLVLIFTGGLLRKLRPARTPDAPPGDADDRRP